jgi:ferredoxin
MNHQRDSLQDEPGVRVKAHPGLCLGYGNCHRFAPDVYELDDEGMIDVHLLEVPSSLALQAWIGATVCPERAITVIGPAEEHWRQRQRAESAATNTPYEKRDPSQ